MQRREFLLLGALGLAGCAAPVKQETAAPAPTFSAAEREQITAWFTQARGRGPARERPAQQVKPGDTLQPGQRPNKLPVDLAAKLPMLPEPYTRLTLGADVILFNRETQRIVDVIPQVAY